MLGRAFVGDGEIDGTVKRVTPTARQYSLAQMHNGSENNFFQF
jgi:hypothetical protein